MAREPEGRAVSETKPSSSRMHREYARVVEDVAEREVANREFVAAFDAWATEDWEPQGDEWRALLAARERLRKAGL